MQKKEELEIEDFDFELDQPDTNEGLKPIAFWVSEEIHREYAIAQKRSKKKFGRFCKKMIIRALEKLNK